MPGAEPDPGEMDPFEDDGAAAPGGGAPETSVSNGGRPIDEATRRKLFQPFFRGELRPNQVGLGLGLHIASEIAKAHRGVLEVTSSERETRFTFSMPLAAPGG